jgi:hypothetical protein
MGTEHLATVLLFTVLGIALIEVPLLMVARRREKAMSRYLDTDGKEWVVFSKQGNVGDHIGDACDGGLPADCHGGHCGGSGDVCAH